MKIKFYYLFAAIIIFCTVCKKDKSLSQTVNLITNPSFEYNGQPTGNTWFYQFGALKNDTLAVEFTNDVPPEGGNWSLKLNIGSTQGNYHWFGFANTYISGINGTHIYNLKAWMKPSLNWHGSINIGKLSNKKFTKTKEVSTSSENWAIYSVTDTITTSINDSIVINLYTGTQPVGWRHYVLFDLIELTKTKMFL